MKNKISMIITIIFSSFILVACTTNKDENKKDYNETNTEVKEANSGDKAFAITITESILKDNYKIDNFKVDYDVKIDRLPDDSNSETEEVYKQLYNARGNFTYQDKVYSYTILYSLKSETEYTTLYFTTTYDTSNVISVPLKSEK